MCEMSKMRSDARFVRVFLRGLQLMIPRQAPGRPSRHRTASAEQVPAFRVSIDRGPMASSWIRRHCLLGAKRVAQLSIRDRPVRFAISHLRNFQGKAKERNGLAKVHLLLPSAFEFSLLIPACMDIN